MPEPSPGWSLPALSPPLGPRSWNSGVTLSRGCGVTLWVQLSENPKRNVGHKEEVLGRTVEREREKGPVFGLSVWQYKLDRVFWEKDSPVWKLVGLAQRVPSLRQWAQPGTLESWRVPQSTGAHPLCGGQP